jgi:hypothetical protein
MWIHFKTAKKVANLFYLIDQHTRFDLSQGLIADERDYTSRMISFFNYPFGLLNLLNVKPSFTKKIKYIASVNKASVERDTGTDSIIIFKKGLELKICLFEGKWPRIYSNSNYRWDKKYKGNRYSHFVSQIERQKKINSNVTIWEMFYMEASPNKIFHDFDKLGSTCILLDEIKLFSNSTNLSTNKTWQNKILNSAVTFAKTIRNDLNIADIIYKVLICNLGGLFKIQSGQHNIAISTNNSENEVKIPIFNLFDDTNIPTNEEFEKSLSRIDVNNYLQFEFSDSVN